MEDKLQVLITEVEHKKSTKLQKLNTELSSDLANPLVSTYPQDLKTGSHELFHEGLYEH